MTEYELKNAQIYSWQDLEDKLANPCLLLGNGFSMLHCSDKFNYTTLFDEFIKRDEITLKGLFTVFETENFEQILKNLESAIRVNHSLCLPTIEIERAITELKDGFINTIVELHPKGASFIKSPEITSSYFTQFGDIFTTNYDLYLYRTIMAGNNYNSSNEFKYQDFFRGENGRVIFDSKRGEERNLKNIYYLHGALFLFKNSITDEKLKCVDNEELIELVKKEIKNGQFPNFVAEGHSTKKLETIYSNRYLAYCFDKLISSDRPIVVFGHSLSEFDKHILEALKKNNRKVFYSIYCGENRLTSAIIEEANRIRTVFNEKNITIIDSSTVFEI